MINLRLHGTIDEITPALETIANNFRVLSVSKVYNNREASVYARVCLDVEKRPLITKAELQAAWEHSLEEGLI